MGSRDAAKALAAGQRAARSAIPEWDRVTPQSESAGFASRPSLQSQTELRSLSPVSTKTWISERSSSFILEISNSSRAASGARWLIEIGSPIRITHLVGSGRRPSGPSSGNVGVTGRNGSPTTRPGVPHLNKIG